MINAKPFEFHTEFTPEGEILSGEKHAFKRVETVEKEVAAAREDAQKQVMSSLDARVAASAEAIAKQLLPAHKVIADVARTLRNDAIDLAMASATVIAGKALDENGFETGSEAVAVAARDLRDAPVIVVLAPPETEQALTMKLGNMPELKGKVRFESASGAKPGDWRIEFSDGAVEFSRDDVIRTVTDQLERRKDDPVEDQLDLFGAA